MFEKEAKEYANHSDWFEFSANVDKIGNAIRTKMEQAYIAGATENGIQWHDLRKDPNDLPQDNKSVWTNKGGAYHDYDGWFGDFGWMTGVIAWCEPQFKE